MMLRSLLAAMAVIASTGAPVWADDCADQFAAIYQRVDASVPSSSFQTTEMKGGPTMTNTFEMRAFDHYLTKPVDPPGPWVLGYANALYQSSDEGKTWVKIQTFDTVQRVEDVKAALAANAETISNTICSQETIDGDLHDVVEGNLKTLQAYPTSNHHKYWVRRSDGFVTKAIYDIKADGFESRLIQEARPMPGLDLPQPE